MDPQSQLLFISEIKMKKIKIKGNFFFPCVCSPLWVTLYPRIGGYNIFFRILTCKVVNEEKRLATEVTDVQDLYGYCIVPSCGGKWNCKALEPLA